MEDNYCTSANPVTNSITKEELLKAIGKIQAIKVAIKISMSWIGAEILKAHLADNTKKVSSKSLLFGIPIAIDENIKYNMAIIEFNNGDKEEIKIFEEIK